MAIPVPIPDFENYTIDECGNITNTVTGKTRKPSQTILTFWIVATKNLTGILPEDMFGSSKGVMTYRNPSPDYRKIRIRKINQSQKLR